MFSLNVHQLGDFLLHAAIVLCAFAALAGLVGRYRRDGRLVLAGERAGYVVTGMIVTAALLLVHSFLTHDYENKYVAHYSDNNMPWYYLIASFWGGQAGSLMFWETVLAIITALVIWQNREQNRDMMPTVLSLLAGLQIFFLGMMVIEANPFATFAINEPPVNGKGLEPLLQNPAMTFHPPSLLSGYVWFSVPFVFAIASLIHRRLDETWIRTTRRYAVISWGFLSMGNLFGGMWAYQELGWGGFWGWDPVENAALMPWISATAYLHSVMIQERRKLLKVWNVYLVLLTGYLTLFGTFLTRAGVIDSVHTFAQSDIGNYFVWLLALCLFGTQALLAWRVADGSLAGGNDDEAWRTFYDAHPARRARAVNLSLLFVAGLNVALFLWANGQATGELRSAAWLIGFAFLGIFGMPLVAVISASVVRNFVAGAEQPVPTARVEDMASREGVFLLNNYVLLSILCVVMFGTVGEKVSLFFWEPTKYSAPWYNGWLAPLGIALLLLMGVGPLVPWRKMSLSSFRTNLLVPLILSILAAAALWQADIYHLKTRVAETTFPIGEVPIGQLLHASKLTGFYTLLGFMGATFTAITLVLEFFRATRVRQKSTRESFPLALGRLVGKNRRRYGGFVTHLGFAALFLGFIGTGLKTEIDMTFNGEGQSQVIEGYQLTFRGFENTENREYEEWFAKFEVARVGAEGVPPTVVGELKPSRRFYTGANVKMSRSTTEKDEIDGLAGNLYLTLVSFRPGFKSVEIMAHYNPMIIWMWLGGALVLLGVVFAIWPESQPYPVFAAARRRARSDAPALDEAAGTPEAGPSAARSTAGST
ncbi:cytochrome c biogenesis protein CcsA [Myxococcota bacterium]|nr:cytochrome c biogenesis protein CcsA [Myxococcota bacterium]